MTVFPISKINALRKKAEQASKPSEDAPPGWAKSRLDPMKLLAVFKALRIKPGFVLRAYQFTEGGNGNGIIWAMAADAPFPEPDECQKLEDRFLQPPRPPCAFDNLLDAIDGDGTPWSFMSASLFAREAAEFGAMWHGCDWSTHKVLAADPWRHDPRIKRRRDRSGDEPSAIDAWKWNEPRPELWEPSFEQLSNAASINFLTFSGQLPEAIYRFTDTFKAGEVTFETKEVIVAEGPGGYVF